MSSKYGRPRKLEIRYQRLLESKKRVAEKEQLRSEQLEKERKEQQEEDETSEEDRYVNNLATNNSVSYHKCLVINYIILHSFAAR